MDLPANPFDAIPVRGWIVFCLAAVAWAPASYVWNYLTHERRPRDITLPPEDLSWKTRGQLYRSSAILTAIFALGVFIFTPAAERLAQSDWLIPSLLGLIGSYALGTLLPAWRKGKIEPLVRGVSAEYDREDQPLRFWASFGWNGIAGAAMMIVSVSMAHQESKPVCNDPDSEDPEVLASALVDCETRIGAGLSEDQLALAMAARGRIHHKRGDNREAVEDYSAAIARNPDDSYALYNRGMIWLRVGNYPAAVVDFNDSLELRPDNPDGYLNRGLAHASMNRPRFAQRDFARFTSSDPQWAEVLGGRGILAMQRKDYEEAIDLSTRALLLQPDNVFLLRLRAQAYWESGELDLARDDDDRRMDIEEGLRPR